MDFKDYSTLDVEYMYNANGSMTKDFNKGISQIQYNSLNLPRIVDVKNQNAEGRNEYTYSASGVKLKAVQRLNSGYSSNPLIGSTINTAALDITKTTDYAGNIIYEDGTLKRILVDGGYYEGGTYYYYLTDHLGNNRIVANASGTVVQKTHYYPFGMPFADATGQDAQPYKYNNKELDTRDGLNWYDYSARYLSLDIPVLPMVDPKAESYPWNSPYMYAGNNPILNFDPDGEDYWSTNDPELIKQFFNSMGRGAKYYDFSGWDHATDAEFVGNGTYNDGTGKFHTSYASYKNGIATVVGVSFDANFKPVSLTGQGYAGAFVYGYGSRGGGLYQAGYNAAQFGELSAFVAEFMSPFDPNSYFDGINNWIVDASGRLTGVNNVQEAKKGGGGNALAKIFIKGFGMVNKEIFHKVIKKSILNATGKGSFSKVIGDNPDITVVNGKIVLQGTKPGFKGKTFNTELNANDFLQ
jgi:RHS repeat-associated protein